MKVIASVEEWELVDRPDWYEGLPVGDGEGCGPLAEQFYKAKGRTWPLVVLSLYPVRPDGGVKPAFSYKLDKKGWFMEPDNAGSGLSPFLARKLAEMLLRYAEATSCA